ncbi:hypothetical protein DMB44_08655 [Thermoplasma sp. Kam2015]|uniref:HFX_2341 family transcriptional regulator domain-containing protein n=1 Tax=Thermoplasma sp. Kam2015 TaxID=2094122 RepID=UPI000D84AFF2|nr:DUF6293 family protein [Thermoplasma sp. Kam2015]PYB67482.1 hypothetical protein DMB44_08655 [Thermoplasma sp. Kam2015]
MGRTEHKDSAMTLQIVAYSDGKSYDGIRAGIRQLPVDKIVILHEETRYLSAGSDQIPFSVFTKQLSDTLGIDVEETKIKSQDLNDVFTAVRNVIRNNEGAFANVHMNVSAASKLLACTPISAGFIWNPDVLYI